MPVFYAPAKINLYLHVTGKRSDGYHLLDSLVVFANDVRDVLRIEPDKRFSLSVNGPFAQNLSGDNLIEKAARFMGHENLRVELEKNIPLGAGLGGGSSDAAAMIKALESLFGVIDKAQRDEILLKLGADVPVCYHAKPARFEGIGEAISDVPALPAFHLLLIWPGVHAATKEVFVARDSNFNQKKIVYPPAFSSLPDFVEFLKKTSNDLSEAAEKLLPPIKETRNFLEQQNGCLLARMSGSGSCVFGLFEDSSLCKTALKKARKNQGWWVHTTAISS